MGSKLFDGEMVLYLTGISPHPLPWTRKRRNLVLAQKVMLVQISVKPSHSDRRGAMEEGLHGQGTSMRKGGLRGAVVVECRMNSQERWMVIRLNHTSQSPNCRYWILDSLPLAYRTEITPSW